MKESYQQSLRRREVAEATKKTESGGCVFSSRNVILHPPTESLGTVPPTDYYQLVLPSGSTTPKGTDGRNQRMLRALPSDGGSPVPTLWSLFTYDTINQEVTPNGT